MKPFAISGREIGPDAPPFVIAEVGINHEGDVNKALQMVDAAAAAGADCVKFQTHITEEEMVPTDMTPGQISSEKLWDIIKRCELNAGEEIRVRDHAREKGILFLSTPFSRAAADRLQALDVPAFKIGSGECNNYPLLDHIASMGRPIILSTGMNDLASITISVETIARHDCPLMLMHCTSMYPTPYELVRLGAIADLLRSFDLPVGLSDHSMGIYTCLGAVALGASALEKHFTITRSWPGPDVPISIEPEELAELVKGARAVWSARGGHKNILPEEQPVIDFAYATVVTLKPVRAGETLNRANAWVKRPGTGKIPAKDFEKVLGMKLLRDLPADVHVAPEDLAGALG